MAYDPLDDDQQIVPDGPPQAPAAAAPPPSPSGITPDTITPDSTPQADDVAPWRKALAAVVRGGSNIAGRLIGGGIGAAVATPADVVVGPAGTAGGAIVGQSIGGGFGSSVGEYLAEKLEGRKSVNPYEVAGEGALGAVPIPGGGTLLRSAAEGAVLAGADPVVRRLSQAAAGDNVDFSELPGEAIRSAVFGGATGAALHGLTNAIKTRFFGGSEPAPVTPASVPAAETPGALYPDMPAASTRPAVTRAGQVQGLDPATFRDIRTGPPAPPVTRSVTPPAPSPVFDEIGALDQGPTVNTPNQIATRAFQSAPPRGTSTIPPETGNVDLDAILKQLDASEGGAGSVTPDVTPEPLEPPTRDTSGQEHFDITPPELRQAGLDLSGSSQQGDLAPITNNASGESAASLEALSRQRSMQAQGQQFVKYDRAGNRTPLIGPDAVDYFPRPGETTGIEGPDGFQLRDDNGGRVPPEANLPQALRDQLRPSAYATPANLEEGAGPTFDLGATQDEAGRTGPAETEYPPADIEETPNPNLTDTGQGIDPAIHDLFQHLSPEWEKTLAAQEGDDIPFKVDPRESLPDFAHRIMTADPRELMGGERKVRAMLDAVKDESGAVNPAALVPLASGGVGALAGAALDPEHPLKGALTGGIAGTGLALALAHPQAAEALRYFGLFASPVTIGKKALGDVGAALNSAFEHAVGGDLQTAKAILSNFFSPQTVRDAIAHFQNADVRPEISEAVGPMAGKIIGAPSRALGAITQAAQDAHIRAGLSPEEAARLTYSGEPTSAVGKAIVQAQREGGPVMRLAMPTAKVMTNIAEKNFQTMPGVGALPLLTKLARGEQIEPGELGQLTARQLAGFLIGAAAYARGAGGGGGKKGPESLPEKFGHAIMAPYAMTDAAGEAIGAALHGKPNPREGTGMRAYNAAKAAILRDLPVPTGADLDPRQWASEFIPNGLQLASTYAPSQYEQTDPLDALIAKIPLLNDMLLTPKRAALKGSPQ